MCAGVYGRIDIQANGIVTILTPFAWSRATCLTSLEGVSYVQTTSASSSVPITPINGWSAVDQSRFLTYTETANLVHLTGELHTAGNNHVPFVVPLAPANDVVVPIGLCNGEVGNLVIDTSGTATIVAAGEFRLRQMLDLARRCLVLVEHQRAELRRDRAAHRMAQPGAEQQPHAIALSRPTTRPRSTVRWEASGRHRPRRTPRRTRCPSGRIQLLASMCSGFVGQLEVFANAATRVWVPNGGGWSAAKCMTSLNGIQYASESIG